MPNSKLCRTAVYLPTVYLYELARRLSYACEVYTCFLYYNTGMISVLCIMELLYYSVYLKYTDAHCRISDLIMSFTEL